MSLQFASLNSGSNANCYYVGDAENAVLIDAGLSCRETFKRMLLLNLKPNLVRAIFISHEHTDHIKGVEVLSRKLQVPVYISEHTQRNSRLQIDDHAIRRIQTDAAQLFGTIAVESFSKHHDAADPYSFVVSSNTVNIGVITDVGHACDNVKAAFSKCHAAILEANYDAHLLESGPYPYHLKQRIKSDKGHLSNEQALQLFLDHRSETLCHLMLGHLSKENNSPEKVHELFTQHAGGTKIFVASRYQASPVFSIQKQEDKYFVTEHLVQQQLFANELT